MNRLERWHAAGVIQIEMAEPARAEAARTDSRRAAKAHSYVSSEELATTPREQELRREIEAVLFPADASTQNEANDVSIVFIALKYGGILVTADGGSRRQPDGILGFRAELARLGAEVLSDEEAVKHVRTLIARRDHSTRLYCRRTGEDLPQWVGQD